MVVEMWIDFIKTPSKFVDWVADWGISRGAFLVTLYGALYLFLGTLIPSLPLYTFNWLFGTAPVWVPIGLVIGFWTVWIWYIQSVFLSGRNPILLEVKMPRNVYKSPRAMEIAYSLLSISSGETTFLHRAWKGQVRPFFSFEMASFGGEIHYYIWCWKNYKAEVEACLYGQYPEVELTEVEDYAMKFDFDPKKYNAFGVDWRLETYVLDAEKDDGHSVVSASNFRINAYQPKTYIDFELDKDPKDEYRVDPLSTVIEFMGSIEPQEQLWWQVVIRKCGDLGVLRRTELDHEWQHMIEHEVELIRKQALKTPGAHGDDPEAKGRFPHPTWKQTEQIRSMERHLGKYPFEVGARGVYITSGHLHGPTYTGMRWLWKPIGNPMYQGHWRPRRWCNDFDWPWQDVADIRWNLALRRYFDAYRRRLFFHSPWIIPTNVVTNETLATMWRPPSNTIATPGLQRIPATKAPPPPNLPT